MMFNMIRGLALFFGLFTMLNLVGDSLRPGFDANRWWIIIPYLGVVYARILLAAVAIILIAEAIRPSSSRLRRRISKTAIAFLITSAAFNAYGYYKYLFDGRIGSRFPLAASLIITIGLVLIFMYLPGRGESLRGGPRRRHTTFVFLLGFALSFPFFAVMQMFCYGYTDYQRKADAAVVFGARVYTDGTLSQALYDRMRTAVMLQRNGTVPLIIVSGGFDGTRQEAADMKEFALRSGVPASAILVDPRGITTGATVKNTVELARKLKLKKFLAVSHFYHLPRIKMAYVRAGIEAYTVPALETYTLRSMPYLIVREIAALWFYYLRALV